MSMPYYVAPEQMMKDRADFARKGIARGKSLVALQYSEGIAIIAENPSNTLRKSSEIYDRIAFAGPFVHDDGSTMLGSLLVIDFPSRDAAHAWLVDEPFTKAGLYGSVSVQAFVNLWPQKAGFPPTA